MDYDKLKSMIERHEGRRKKPYKCTAGKITIGVGHNLDDLGLPDRMIDELLELDIGNAISDCASLYPNWHALPDTIQMVLIDMMFNMGLSRMQQFKKMNRAVEDHNWATMIKEMQDSRWFAQVGNRAKELQELVRSVT